MKLFGVGSALTFLVAWLKGKTLWQSLTLVAFFLALKALLVSLITVSLAVIFHNFVLDFLFEWISSATASLPDGGLSSTIYQLTGLGGWVGSQLRLPECFSVIVSASIMVGVRRFIPFF